MPAGFPQNSGLVGEFFYRGWAPDYYVGPLLDWSDRKRLFATQNLLIDRSQEDQNDRISYADATLTYGPSNPSYIQQWYSIVAKDFMQRNLGSDSDRFPALQGLANHIEELTGSKYMSGHFEHQILRSLLWYQYLETSGTHVTPSFSPSWSWVAARGKRSPRTICTTDDPLELCAEYLGATLIQVKDDGKTPVSAQGYQLQIRGHIMRVGGETGVMLERKTKSFEWTPIPDFETTFTFSAEGGENLMVQGSSGSMTNVKLTIEIRPDRPSELVDMFPQVLECDITGWSPCKGPGHSSLFLLPIGLTTSEVWRRQLHGLLLTKAATDGDLFRRFGTFDSLPSGIIDELTPKNIFEGLFKIMKEHIVLLG